MTPYYSRVRVPITDSDKLDEIDEIDEIYENYIITQSDANLFRGYPSPYAFDGKCTFSDEEEGLQVFKDYLIHATEHFVRFLK